jgi:DNA processing protein
MDELPTPASSWLAFALAFEDSTSLITHLRENNFSPAGIGSLITRHLNAGEDTGDGYDLSAALCEKLSKKALSALQSDDLQAKIEAALDWEQQHAAHNLIGLDHPCYPPLLLNTSNPPPLLYAKGQLSALRLPAIAIVGSRKASHQAITHTRTLAAQLANRGLAIVSGLAMGIDAAAHEGALDAQGTTIVVSATEPNTIYPRRHCDLANRIVDSGGLILSEYPLGAPTLRWFFPRRNRIISGMCEGVVVAEAALPSGSLTTANHAMNQGREVMAIPGAIGNPNARGCHDLIKNGAALIEGEQDVLDTLGVKVRDRLDNLHSGNPKKTGQTSINRHSIHASTQPDREFETDDTDRVGMAILDYLAAQPATVDELVSALRDSVSCNPADLYAAIGFLQIAGKITASSGGRYSRC